MAQIYTSSRLFNLIEEPLKIIIEFLDTPNRFYSHEVIIDSPFKGLNYSGKEIVLTGKAPNWLYLHAAYFAHKNGAKEIVIQKVDEKFVKIFPVNSTIDDAAKEWYNFEKNDNELTITFLKNKQSAEGFWGEEVLGKFPLDLKTDDSKSKQLVVTGSGSVWMYAASGVAASIFGYELVVYDSPREEFLILVGNVDPGFLKVRKIRRDYPGLVIGVVGDPNSGKSVFSKVLYQVLEKYYSSIWLFDCDAASPTANWYLHMLNSGKKNEGNLLREKTKVKWTPTLEAHVADCLKSLKDNLEIVIADLPGGIHSEGKPIARIPKGREVVMKRIDLFIILGKSGKYDIVSGWRKELEVHGLENCVIAEIESACPKSEPDLKLVRKGCLITGNIEGLDRENGVENITSSVQNSFNELIRHIKNWRIAMQAREATAKAFLTNDGGVCYGSAARCVDDSVYTSGQYSSFNHVTNVHAEQSVLVSASMAGTPDVVAIAIACTKKNTIARPCGVCRQVMLEHATRTGRDFDIVMVDDKGRYEINKVSELLPMSWSSHRQERKINNENLIRNKPLFTETIKGLLPVTGDQLLVDDKYVAMVWDEKFSPNVTLVKLKYFCDNEKCIKIPHSFTESIRYESYLHENKMAISSDFGMKAAFVKKNDSFILNVAKNLSKNDLPTYFFKFLEDTGIDVGKITCSGSRSLQMQGKDSDWDLIVPANPEQIIAFRKSCRDAIALGKITVPETSATWGVLSQIFKLKPKDIIEQQRFSETLNFEGHNVVFIFIPLNGYEGYVFDNDWVSGGRGMVGGTVISSDLAPYKRSIFTIKSFSGKDVEVVSYHKTANLVKVGDIISLTGWTLHSKKSLGKSRLVQMHYSTDKIVWMEKSLQ